VGSLTQLLFPSSCIICGSSGLELCSLCDKKIIRNRQPLKLDGIRVYSAAYYGDELAKVIVLAKEKNNLVARNFLVKLLVQSFMEVATGAAEPSGFTLVPIPSRRAANRKRGFRHCKLLAQGIAQAVKGRCPGGVRVEELLTVNRRTADQSALSNPGRFSNISGAYSLVPFKAIELGSILLVDDLVTSGSSMREGLRSLKEAGIAPFGALSAGVSHRVFS
jgi:predicted amidophosphoribosyltransferase